MKITDCIAILKTLPFPVFYDHAEIGTKVPFGTIQTEQPNNFAADNSVYFESYRVTLTCYFEKKDPTKEAAVKKLLNDNGFSWTKSETYVEDNNCYAIAFEFGILAEE